ncbi:ATP-dependent helicase [Candidatus Peribacteria bacterium]|nr:ATP-dependent helicase [Candidatus Peribacteria bacterium]
MIIRYYFFMNLTTPTATGKETKVASPRIFDSEYQKLNLQQRQAVDTIEGPVMVVAGPGTGKTQVLSMRVANILKKTQMRPGNILCLTYSVSGTTAMRDRLRLLIGADAYGVKVSTIHAFAQSIIEENGIVFDEWSAREQISDLEKIRSMNTIIDQFSSYMKLINQKDPYGRTEDILSRISQVKREGKSLADLHRAAGEYDELMATKSKTGTKVHEKNLLSAQKFRDFVTLFGEYQSMMERTGRYDYEDMILHVIRALEEEDWLLSNLQERFQYVLVDEFQDTNGSQYRLIELLTTYKDLPNEPNVFVVGDDDQSIYRFQGANLQNMLSFHTRFPKAPVIALTTSYRSTQAILDAARSLIEKNEERLVGKIPGLQKLLTAATATPSPGPSPLRGRGELPTLLRAPSNVAEPWLIADLLEERIQKGAQPEEIAVLTQKNDELFDLYAVLRARKIPVLMRGKDDLLSHPLVLQAVTILQAIDHPHTDGLLSGALACGCFALHPADLGRLQGLARDRKAKLFDLLEQLPSQEELPLLQREDLERVRNALFDLHQKIPSRTVLETVENVLRDCALIPQVEEGADSPVDPRDVAALEAFFGYVRGRCLERRGWHLRDLLADISLYADPGYRQIRLTYELPHLSTAGVRLMTAHQSKGLEFHTVILSNFRDGHWDKRKRPTGVSIPEDLLYGWEKDQKTFEQHQDERRIAFVAITRAKRELIMVCPLELTVGEKSKAVAPSAFFAEMGQLPEENVALRDPEGASLLLRPRLALIDGALRAYLEERLKTFALSPTALNRFLRDPQEFLLVDLLQQPEHFDESSVRGLGYGSAVHWALRQWAVAVKENKEFAEPDILEAFAWHLRERTILTSHQQRDLLAMGNEALPKYFAHALKGTFPVLHAIERDYRAHVAEIPIKGKIDRIDLASSTSATATVIDYKTGRPKTEVEIRGGIEPGSVSKTSEGDYFRQLTFYAVLLDHADPLLKPELFSLEYIGERGENPLTRSFMISEAEKDDLRTLIRQVWDKIVKMDFTLL